MAVISVRDVTFSYGSRPDHTVLTDVTCAIEPGSFVGITGPDGAGKTTLCRLLAGYIPRFFEGEFTGEVDVTGTDLTGLVFDNPYDQLTGATGTVMEEVAFGLENLGLPREEIIARAEQAMADLGVAELADRHPLGVSGGQAQRVALASLLAMRPDVIVLDEPTSQLDPMGSAEVLGRIMALNAEGYTTVLVSQDLADVIDRLDRLIVMDGGRVVHDGAPADVVAALLDQDRVRVPEAARIHGLARTRGLLGEGPVAMTPDDLLAALRAREAVR